MKAVVTGVDRYRWTDDDGGTHSARKGEEIDVSDAEFKRGEEMGALAKPRSKDAKAAQADESDTSESS